MGVRFPPGGQKMSEDQKIKLNTLLQEIIASPSSFYRNHFKKNNYSYQHLEDSSDLKKIPRLNWRDIEAVPFLERLYHGADESIFTKIIYREEKIFLWALRRKDAGREPYGVSCERPLLLFRRHHDGVEKGLWFYEHNILPLMKEPNYEIAAMTAKKYGIDAIVGETKELETFLPYLMKEYSSENIKKICIVDTQFDPNFITEHFPQAETIFKLALPETGVIAEAVVSPSKKEIVSFETVPSVIAEIIDEKLIITKTNLLPTPLIRYETELQVSGDAKSFTLR